MTRILPIFITALVLLAGCKGRTEKKAVKESTTEVVDETAKYTKSLLKPGIEAPDFSMPDANGGTFTLSTLNGKWIVLDFWASWCPDCRKENPAMTALHDEYAQKDVQFVGVSFDTDAEAWKEAIEKDGLKWLQVSELKKRKDTAVSSLYGINWIPSFYLINPEGKVQFAGITADALKDALKKAAI